MITCLGLLTFGYAGLSESADWKFYYQTQVQQDDKEVTQKLFYDESSIENPQKGIIRVIQKTVVLNSENESELVTRTMEIDCSSRKYRLLTVTKLQEETGKVLSEERTPDAVWIRFGYQSATAGLADNLCYAKKTPKEKEKKPAAK